MDNKNLGYTLGRLCALTEFLHESCRNKYGRVTDIGLISQQPFNMVRQFTSATSDCLTAMPEYKSIMMQIVNDVPATGLPKRLSIDEQGQFMLGYFYEKGNLKTIRLQIGNNIAKLRKEKGWSQEILSEKANVTKANITNIELGKYSTGVDILGRIANALGCSPKDLMPEN